MLKISRLRVPTLAIHGFPDLRGTFGPSLFKTGRILLSGSCSQFRGHHRGLKDNLRTCTDSRSSLVSIKYEDFIISLFGFLGIRNVLGSDRRSAQTVYSLVFRL